MVNKRRLLTKMASRMCKNMKHAPHTTWAVPTIRKMRASTASSGEDIDEDLEGDVIES